MVSTKGLHGFHKWQSEDNIDYIKSFIGSDVEFREVSGNRVVGTVNRIDQNSFYLIDTQLNRKYFGDYVIHDYEVKNWRLKEWRKRDVNPNRFRAHQPKADSSKVLIPPNINGREDDEYGSGDECYVSSELESIDLNEDDDPIEINLKHMTQKASTNMTLIEVIDQNFEPIIDSIISSKCVGFGLFGQEVSRDGSVDLMVFANEEAIYVFDVSNKDIVCRLKQLLESEEVQKVMFSCRHSSDALFHLFGIELKNVVDVRINDYYLQKKQISKTHNNRLMSRPYLRSYDKLLFVYFRLKAPNLYRNVDYRQFSVRVKNVIKVKIVFLRELLAIINYKLLEEVYQMTDRCVRSLRSANDLEFVAMTADERELELLENPINECEEIEKRIINLFSFKPIPNGINGTNGYHNQEEPVIRFKSKPKTNGHI